MAGGRFLWHGFSWSCRGSSLFIAFPQWGKQAFGRDGGATQVAGGGALLTGVATGNETAVRFGEIAIGVGAALSTLAIAPAFIGKASPRVANFMMKARTPAFRHSRVMREQMANAARSSKAPTFNEVTGTIWSRVPFPKTGF
jgi:hypothetical protein